MQFDLSAFEGLQEAIAREAELLEKLVGSTEARSKIKSGLDVIAKDAKARVHNITGNLSRGIKSKVKVSADSPTVGEVGVSYKESPKAHHAHLVEGGHGGKHGPAAPHPFWEPAIRATGEEAVQCLADAVNNLIDELWK